MTAGLCVSLVLEPGTIAVILSLIALSSLVMVARGGSRRLALGWNWLGRLFTFWGVALIRPLLDNHKIKQ